MVGVHRLLFCSPECEFLESLVFLCVDDRGEVTDVYGFDNFNAPGIMVCVDDCGVVDKMLACQWCVVLLLHVCFDGSVLQVHCEAS